jgi:hypothetical protein
LTSGRPGSISRIADRDAATSTGFPACPTISAVLRYPAEDRIGMLARE